MKNFLPRCLALLLMAAMLLTLLPAGNAAPTTRSLVASQTNYAVMDGVTESSITLDDGNSGCMLQISPDAPATLYASPAGYYTEGSTKASRTEALQSHTYTVVRPTEQAAAYEAATGRDVVFTCNANFFNTTEYIPRGLVMAEGNVVHESTSDGGVYFARLKDGSYVFRTYTEDYSDVVEAIAGRQWLVRDGVLQTQNDVDISARTAIGLKADGTVVCFAVNGKSSSFGVTINDMCELMYSLGCVNAVNIDGGGSTLFATQRGSSEDLVIRNTPTDSNGERAVVSALMLVKDPDADQLFMDFTNDAPDQQRYEKSVYGGLNYDIEGWHYNYNHDAAPVFDNDAGTMTVNKVANAAARSIHTVIMSSNTSYTGGHPLSYVPHEDDYFAIRMKISGATDTAANFRLKFATEDGTSSDHMGFSCAIPSGVINSGQFFTLSGPLNSLFVGADMITALRPEVYNLTVPANETGLSITYDYIYVGRKDQCPVPQSLYFGFENLASDQSRYSIGAYGAYNFDEAETPYWASLKTGSNTAYAIDNDLGVLTLPVTEEYTGVVGTNDVYGPYISTTNVSGAYPGSNVSAYAKYAPLRFVPEQAEVLQLRFKVSGCEVVEGKTPRVVCLFHYSENGTDLYSQSVGRTYSYTDGVCQTLTIALPDTLRSADFIHAVGLRFQNLKSSSGGQVTLDYIYVGNGPETFVKDELFFDFTNTPEDRERYASTAYGAQNFDLEDKSYWVSAQNGGSSAFTVDNERGVLSLNVTENYTGTVGSNEVYGPYLATTTAAGYFPNSNPTTYAKYAPLFYDPAQAECLQIRFKVSGCEVVEGKTPRVACLFHYTEDGTALYNQSGGKYYSYTDGVYQTLTIALPDAIMGAEALNSVGLRFQHIKSADGGKVEIDYIYVGPEDGCPVDDTLFFDFNNSTADQERYASTTYGGLNFDAAETPYWSTRADVSGTTENFSINNTAGTLNLTVTDTNVSGYGPYLMPTSEHGVYGVNAYCPLSFRPDQADYLQIRFKISGCQAQSSTTPLLYALFTRVNDGVATLDQTMNQRFTFTDGAYQTVTIPLTDSFKQADEIRNLGFRFRYVQPTDTTGTVTIDYIRVGKDDPGTSLLFGFGNTAEDQLRYESSSYSFKNFDTGNWYVGNTLTDAQIQTDSGVFTAALADGKSNCNLRTAFRGGAEEFPLNYVPGTDDQFQIRLRIDGAEATADALWVDFYFYSSSAGAWRYIRKEVAADRLNSGYFIVTLPAGENGNYAAAGTISSLQVNLSNFQSSASKTATITVDYIYLGTETELPTAHRYSSHVTAPTCTAGGYTTYTCSVCGHSYVADETASLGHSYTSVVTAPTCTAGGYTTYTCTVCGHSYKGNYTSATGHSYSYTNSGAVHTLTCSGCGDSYTEAHSYVKGVCVCGAKLADLLVFKSATVTLESDLSMNFYVAKAALDGFSDPCVTFQKAIYDEKGSVTDYEETTVTEYAEKTAADGTECYVFTFTDISAKEMSSVVSVTLSGSYEGTVYSGNAVSYSVKQYAENLLSATEDAALRILLVDMLNYGAEAQSYFAYNTANLANADLTDEQKAWASQEELSLMSSLSVNDNEGQSVYFESAALLLEEKVTMHFYLDLDEYTGALEDLYARVFFENAKGDLVEYTIEGTELTELNGDHVLYFDGLNAAQMRSIIGVELYSRQTASCVSQTLYYSIESYAHNKLTDSSLNPLVTAMMRYGDSVAAYAAQ